jgi:rod shape-determining protein MreD
MQLVKYIIIYFLLLFVEKNLIHLISIKGITPDLILIFIIIISLRENKNRSTVIGFLAGLIQDVFTTGFWGLSALTKSIVGFWGAFFQQPKKRYNLSSYVIAVSILVLVHETIFGFIYNIGTHLGFFQLVFQFMLPRAFYTSLFAVIIYLIFKPMLWKSESIA